MARVLITTPNFGSRSDAPWRALKDAGLAAQVEVTRHPLPGKDLARLVTEADALIVGLDTVDDAVLEAASRLRVVAKHGVGVDNIDVTAAVGRGVVVTNAPGISTGAVADLTMGLLLAAVRHIPEAHHTTTEGQWRRFYGPELTGRTLAVLGFGRIGRAVARRARGFGMDVVAYDPFLPGGEHDGTTPLPLENCLAAADVVTLHVPGGPGKPLLGGAELASMRRGGYLVNTARGDLVDEAALADALSTGHLAGAAIDTFAVEPPTASPLLTAPNVVLSPHVGANSDDANAALGVTVVEDVARVLAGDEPKNPVVP